MVKALEAVDALARTSSQRSQEAEWIKNRLAKKRCAAEKKQQQQRHRQQQQQLQQALVQVHQHDKRTVRRRWGVVCEAYCAVLRG